MVNVFTCIYRLKEDSSNNELELSQYWNQWIHLRTHSRILHRDINSINVSIKEKQSKTYEYNTQPSNLCDSRRVPEWILIKSSFEFIEFMRSIVIKWVWSIMETLSNEFIEVIKRNRVWIWMRWTAGNHCDNKYIPGGYLSIRRWIHQREGLLNSSRRNHMRSNTDQKNLITELCQMNRKSFE